MVCTYRLQRERRRAQLGSFSFFLRCGDAEHLGLIYCSYMSLSHKLKGMPCDTDEETKATTAR